MLEATSQYESTMNRQPLMRWTRRQEFYTRHVVGFALSGSLPSSDCEARRNVIQPSMMAMQEYHVYRRRSGSLSVWYHLRFVPNASQLLVVLNVLSSILPSHEWEVRELRRVRL